MLLRKKRNFPNARKSKPCPVRVWVLAMCVCEFTILPSWTVVQGSTWANMKRLDAGWVMGVRTGSKLPTRSGVLGTPKTELACFKHSRTKRMGQ